MLLTEYFKNSGLTTNAQQHIFIHQQNKGEAEVTQNTAALETPWTLVSIKKLIIEVNKYLKITLSVFVVLVVCLAGFLWNKSSKKKELSQVSWIPVTHTYRFKNHKAEELSVSAFNLKKEDYYNQAIDLYHEAIKIEPDNPKLYFDLAECYGKNDQLQQAIMSMNSAIILDSTYAGFYSNRGLYYYHLFKDEKAVADLEKAVQLDNKSPVAYYNLSIVYYSTNSLDNACHAFKQAKTFGLNTDDLKNQKEFIKLEELCK